MYINSHDLGSRKSETILDTKVDIMKFWALWLKYSFNSFLLGQLKTKFALKGDLYRPIILLMPLNTFIALNIKS